jgi:hypothetical protein
MTGDCCNEEIVYRSHLLRFENAQGGTHNEAGAANAACASFLFPAVEGTEAVCSKIQS